VYRVVGPGGRFVLSHTDFDTLIFTSEDLQLTRRLIRAYCDPQQDFQPGELGYGCAHNLTGRHGPAVKSTRSRWTVGWPACAGWMWLTPSSSASTTTR